MEKIDTTDVDWTDDRTDEEREADINLFVSEDPEIPQMERDRVRETLLDSFFLHSLSLNRKAIAEDTPVIIARHKREMRGHESESTMMGIRLSRLDMLRLVMEKEQNSKIYKTNADVFREWVFLGKMVSEAVRLSPEFRESKTYKFWQSLDAQEAIDCQADVAIDHIRSRSIYYLKKVISREEFIRQVNDIVGACSLPVRAFVEPFAEAAMTEHGLEEEKKKMQEREKKRKYRVNLRLVEKEKA